MKPLLKFTLQAFTTACLTGIAAAQQMTFSDSNLVSGSELQTGSAYRFSNVTSGADAVVTIDALTNTTLLSVDASSANSIENAAWRPTFAGTGGEGLHYADFTINFYAGGTNSDFAPESFTSAIYGNDLSDFSNGFVMEFAHASGFTSTLSPDGATWLTAWDFKNKFQYSVRMGWQGANGDARTFSTVMNNTSSKQSISPVPEPSSALLIIISVLPLALRRKRP